MEVYSRSQKPRDSPVSYAHWAKALSPNVTHSILSAGATFRINRTAELEVTDLVGEGDVVRMGSPRQPCVLAGAGIHGMEIVRQIVSGGLQLVGVGS